MNRNTNGPKALLLFLALSISFSPSQSFSQTCDLSLMGGSDDFSNTLDGRWRKTEGTLYDALRANAPHQMKALVEESHNPVIPQLVKIKGTVVGDFHLLNLGDIELADHSRKIGVVDIDDGGVKAPLIDDVTRALVGANLSGFGISMEVALEAYLKGLSGHKTSKPNLVIQAENASADEFLGKQADWMDKVTTDKKFNSKSKVQRIEAASIEVRNLFSKAKSSIESSLGGRKVLDFGFRNKDGGGSQGLPRFWFLVENKAMPKNIEAIEFKFLGRPASDLASPQPTHDIRVAEISKAFRPSESVYGTYQVIKTEGGYFLARTRLKNFISIDLTDSFSSAEKKDIADYYLYLINRLGTNHANQLGAKNDLEKILSVQQNQASLLQWCQDYIKNMKDLNQ